MKTTRILEQLEKEVTSLRGQLEEANDTIEAIRSGQIDALIVKHEHGHQIYTLKSADQTYRVFIEKMKEGAVTLNQQGIILYSNFRFASMMNLPLSKVIGIDFKKLVARDNLKVFHQLTEKGWKTESKGELYLVNQQGELIPFMASLTTLELEEGTALSIILSDLSVLKESEKQLKLKNDELSRAYAVTEKLNDELEEKVESRTRELLVSREHFKFLADNVPAIIWTALPNGDLNYYNKRWFEYTGRSFEETQDKGWQSIIHPDDLQPTLDAWASSIKTGASYHVEYRFKRGSDGEYRWHCADALPFFNEKKEIVAWFGICTDIEDQKKVMAKKDEFISMAGHELKTPVTTLKAYMQFLQITFENEGHQMASEMLVKMDKQINNLTSLITDLLDVSKANAGQLKFDMKPFDLNEMVTEIADEMQGTVKTHTIELRLSDMPSVVADRNRIAQVAKNLISNAIKYSPKANKITITSAKSEDKATLCVEDFGIGIPKSQQAKLFTRFFRVNGDTLNTFPGLGLGLYISSEIIKQHSGTIFCRSEEGKGSTFCFSLPLNLYDIVNNA